MLPEANSLFIPAKKARISGGSHGQQLGLGSMATHAARDSPLAAQSCSQLRKTEDTVVFNPCHLLAFRKIPEGYRKAFIPLRPFCSVCVKSQML